MPDEDYEDEDGFLPDEWFKVLCGCGDPVATFEMLRDYADFVGSWAQGVIGVPTNELRRDQRTATWEERKGYVMGLAMDPDGHDTLTLLVEYACHSLNLLEHGGSVHGSWRPHA